MSNSVDKFVAEMFRSTLRKWNLQSNKVTTKFGEMHYYDSHPNSNLKPLVLLHGIGSSGQCFALLALMLQNRRRVVCPDLFHFSGFSICNKENLSIHEHTDSVHELIVKLFPNTSVDFCGLSMGGWIALWLAARFPECISRLCLLNPAGLEIRPYELRDKILLLNAENFETLYKGMMFHFPLAHNKIVSSVVRRSLFQLLTEEPVKEFVRNVKSADFVDNHLNKIESKTLLLWGNKDGLIPHETTDVLLKNIKNCVGYNIENAAHATCVEAPIAVLEKLCAFFEIPDNRGFFECMLRRVFPNHSTVKLRVH
jgi:abhydrolase domain-containing protein 6